MCYIFLRIEEPIFERFQNWCAIDCDTVISTFRVFACVLLRISSGNGLRCFYTPLLTRTCASHSFHNTEKVLIYKILTHMCFPLFSLWEELNFSIYFILYIISVIQMNVSHKTNISFEISFIFTGKSTAINSYILKIKFLFLFCSYYALIELSLPFDVVKLNMSNLKYCIPV